jgi:hypothetical protein
MNALLEAFEIDTERAPPPFQQVAHYFAHLDCLIYLRRDCAYRALRLAEYVTILLDPQTDEAVGVKIKGTRHVTERFLAIMRAGNARVDDGEAINMIALAETALSIDGESAIVDADGLRRRYFDEVRSLSEEAGAIDRADVEVANA